MASHQCRSAADPRHRLRPLLRPRDPRRGRRPDHRGVRRGEGDVYFHFPAKDDLVLAYLDTVDDVWSGQLRAAAEAAGPKPADQLVGLFDALATACRRDGYRGCAFINAAAENKTGTPVHGRTLAHKEDGAVVGRWPGTRGRRARRRGSRARTDARARRGTGERGPRRPPDAPVAAKEAARLLVAAATACPSDWSQARTSTRRSRTTPSLSIAFCARQGWSLLGAGPPGPRPSTPGGSRASSATSSAGVSRTGWCAPGWPWS